MNSARQQRQVLEKESLGSSVCCCFIMNAFKFVMNDLKIVFEKTWWEDPSGQVLVALEAIFDKGVQSSQAKPEQF